jgi:ankyrin repeat protein
MTMFKRFPLLFMALVSSYACSACAQPEIDKMTARQIFADKSALELALAGENGDVARIDTMVKAGAKVNTRGKYAITPLLYVFFRKNKEGYAALLRHKADPNITTTNGQGAAVMNEAAAAPDSFWLAEALKHGGNPDLENVGNRFSPGDTPLFYAALAERTENVRLLLAKKANVKRKNQRKDTALHLAVGVQAYDIVLLLLDAGADYNEKNSNGKSLIDWVDGRSESLVPPKQMAAFRKTIEFLRKKGIKITTPEE